MPILFLEDFVSTASTEQIALSETAACRSLHAVSQGHCGLSLALRAIILSPTEIAQCWPGRAVSRDCPNCSAFPSAAIPSTAISIRMFPSASTVGVIAQR